MYNEEPKNFTELIKRLEEGYYSGTDWLIRLLKVMRKMNQKRLVWAEVLNINAAWIVFKGNQLADRIETDPRVVWVKENAGLLFLLAGLLYWMILLFYLYFVMDPWLQSIEKYSQIA